ncbi:MAG TPA: hypothetical protein VGH54_13405 [Mycobacterium sp.]|uniref:hypothetical protein n=1 Tax=Mycobacterium sp. TaxID=1785 RepID=UPI002F407645
MSIDLTPEGKRAYEILRWVQENPADRAKAAQGKVNDLARPLLDDPGKAQALREVQDAGTTLARIADAL